MLFRSKVLDVSMALMKKMVDERAPDLVRSIMRALRNAATLPPDEAMREETRIFCDLARKARSRWDGVTGDAPIKTADDNEHERT